MRTISYATRPALSPVIDGELWELSRDWSFRLRGDPFKLPEGFLTDGASIPRFLWRLCGHPMLTHRIVPALVHDAIYAGVIKGFTRQEADEIFRDGLVESGWPRWKAALEYAALRLFGSTHWQGSTVPASLLAGLLTPLVLASLLASLGCARTIDIVVNSDGWSAHYANYGLKTDVSSIEAEKSADGSVKVKVKGLVTDVSAENKEIVAAGGTAVGNIAEKVIEAAKK